jgi:hypothetical protein
MFGYNITTLIIILAIALLLLLAPAPARSWETASARPSGASKAHED